MVDITDETDVEMSAANASDVEVDDHSAKLSHKDRVRAHCYTPMGLRKLSIFYWRVRVYK